jgi:hypothetical protein
MATDFFSTTSSIALDPNVQGSTFTNVDTLNNPDSLNFIELNKSASSFQVAAAGPNLQVITPNTNVVQNRMVFSTFNEQARLSKNLTLRNTGNQALTITGLRFGDSQEKNNAIAGRLADHERAADFKFANTIKLPLTIAAGGSINLPVQFLPKRDATLAVGDSPTHTKNGENYASLTISSNDPDQRTTKVNLAGLNATNITSDFEASLAEVVRSFGWTTDIGSEDNKLGVSRTLFGDEVYSPYWMRADASKPVELFPIAAYSSPSDEAHDGVAFQAKAGTGGRSGFLYALAGRLQDDNLPGSNDRSGGENQKLLPKILVNGKNTTPTSSTVDFNPNSPFALKRGDGFTDDNLNGTANTRAWRIYPLINANGSTVSNTWIATCDVGTNVGRNGDFQDAVYLFKNAKPASRTLSSSANSLVSSSPDLISDSNTTSASTLIDNNSQTIGASTQLNKNDAYTPTAFYQPSVLNIAPTSTDTLNTNTVDINNDNLLVNGLQTTSDSGVGNATILTNLLNPLTNLNLDFRQGSAMLSSDGDNYIKLLAQVMPDGNLGLHSAKGISTQGNNVSDETAYNPLSNS